MPVERAHVAIENLIADHVAASFRSKERTAVADNTAAQIRSRITDRFQHAKIGSEQDNAPPAIVALRDRIITIFSPPQKLDPAHDRAEQLTLLQASIEELRRHTATIAIERREEQSRKPRHVDLLLERQQLVLKNEFTEGFGRVETWLVSIAALALVLLRAIDFLWALPILALGIGRSCYLDRQCKKRSARIAEIDAMIEPAPRQPYN
ncbi:hypothetical protein [Microvirga solisilvae]|uniref:hypothetical protein n=1 Tax=Microvirga solisilvae TaxID=2919498 RepID=UPI001FB0027F|nr:hypothetical protein [Microvirga solisilvae]